MKKTLIQELREKIKNETISQNELLEIEMAFERIPDEQLRDERENATPDDMLDELEAQNE